MQIFDPLIRNPPEPPQNPASHDVNRASEFSTFKKLSALNPTKAQGPDGIPGWLLKENADLLARPVTEILNSSFYENRLPPSWKKYTFSRSRNKSQLKTSTNISVPFPSHQSYLSSLKTTSLRNTLNQLCYKNLPQTMWNYP